MGFITLYHGSPNPILEPSFEKGKEHHDYGKGLYLTPDKQLAREWAVCNETDGYLFALDIDLDGLNVLDFDQYDPLIWIAELMSHRDADNSVRYKRFAPQFIRKYKMNTSAFDVIRGWRADSSYFLIAKRFVRDELDASLLRTALKLGDLGIQYCIKSEWAFKTLEKFYEPIEEVSMDTYLKQYNERDYAARQRLYELINSERNTLKDTFSNYI